MKLAPLALLAVLAACQTAPVDPDTARREAYLEAHLGTKPLVAEAIRAGQIRDGMTFREVEASLGPPEGEPIDIEWRPSGRLMGWISSWEDVWLTFLGATPETARIYLDADCEQRCPPGLIMP
jgi:hypothetical protein